MAGTTQDPNSAPAPDDGAGPHDRDSVKDAFRAALERKRGRRHPHEQASDAGAKIHDTQGAVGGKREFRRKSG